MGQSSLKVEENLKSSIPPTQGFSHFMETSDRSLVALSTPFCQCGENDLQMSQPQVQRHRLRAALSVVWEESAPEDSELGSAFPRSEGPLRKGFSL